MKLEERSTYFSFRRKVKVSGQFLTPPGLPVVKMPSTPVGKETDRTGRRNSYERCAEHSNFFSLRRFFVAGPFFGRPHHIQVSIPTEPSAHLISVIDYSTTLYQLLFSVREYGSSIICGEMNRPVMKLVTQSVSSGESGESHEESSPSIS